MNTLDPHARPAEDYGDYRFFRFLALNSARLVVACLFLIAWNLAAFRQWETIIFLGNTLALALGLSLVAGTVSYSLFKRRGGKIEKTPPPVGV